MHYGLAMAGITTGVYILPNCTNDCFIDYFSYMTREQYHQLAPTFDLKRERALLEVKNIPLNVNRAGAYYKHLLRDIERRHTVTL